MTYKYRYSKLNCDKLKSIINISSSIIYYYLPIINDTNNTLSQINTQTG